MQWTINQLLEALHQPSLQEEGQIRFNRLWSDTRSLQAGDCYLAIKGAHFDGHEFAEEAVKKGAVAILASESLNVKVPVVLVEDTRLALGQFAQWHRTRMPLKTLIAVTGSNGKTTTKTMLQSILENIARTCTTEGNLNNDFGVPRTLLTIDKEDTFAVIEMGANHLKDIEYLTHLAKPDVALITNASGAHLEGFGSLQGVINTKGEIYQGLSEDGTAILNLDSVGYQTWYKLCTQRQQTMLTFGENPLADVCVSQVETDSQSICFNLILAPSLNQTETVYSVKMPVLGRHNALNAAAAVAACLAAGLNMPQILPGLVNFSPVAGRLKTHSYQSGVLIDDAYNANPASVMAGLDTLKSLPGEAIACLGGMAELGEGSEAAHQDIAQYAKQLGIANLYLFGEATKGMVSVFGEGAFWFKTHEELVNALQAQLLNKQNDSANAVFNILVKGSRSANMDWVVSQLLEDR